MHFKQFYLGCLAHASYLVGDEGADDEGLCAVVDPQRDVEQYLAEAEARGLRIAHVIETHLHADFVSGHVELAARTGATIHVGHRAGAGYEHRPVRDGDELRLGSVVLRFLETPGHTPESLCVLVTDTSDPSAPGKLLTGDTLFIGDVGRPDLVGSKGRTAEEMAGMMYDSLQAKILPLPDATEVYPAHGAGSACGRNISSALSSTLGEQKATNAMLQPMTREQFVERATAGLGAPPRYFAYDAELNRTGPGTLDELSEPEALDPAGIAAAVAGGALVLDVRPAADFGSGHLPGSVNVGLGGSFASWCGQLLPVEAPLVVVSADEDGLREAVLRLARVGMHGVAGWLAGGVEAWRAAGRPLAELPQLDVAALRQRLGAADAPRVLDVRTVTEHGTAHVPGARHQPLPDLPPRLDAGGRLTDLDRDAPVAVVCKSGYRSSAAASLLQRAGYTRVMNVVGGTDAWLEAGYDAESGLADAACTG